MAPFINDFVGYCRKNLLLVILVSFVITSGVFLYLWINRLAYNSLNQQTLRKLTVVAKAGGKSIENFIELTSNSLLIVSSSPSLSSFSDDSQVLMDSFYEKWKDTPVLGVILVDKTGTLTYSAEGLEVRESNIDLSDRDYFIWAKEASENEVFIGMPIESRIGKTKGRYVLPIATPVFKNGEFNGVLTSAFDLSDFSKSYLEPLKLSDETEIYLIDEDGTLLYSPYENLIGVNYFDYLRDKVGEAEISGLSFALSSQNEDSLNIFLPNEKTGKNSSFSVAYYPIVHNGDRFLLVVALPSEALWSFYWPFRIGGIILLCFVITIAVFFSFLFVIGKGTGLKEGYQMGIKDGKDSK